MGMFLLVLMLMPLTGCARDELLPFDYEKAKQLSPEKRREYDVIFFNEVAVWNMNSNRYSQAPGAPFIERDAEFRRMAADGYLLAYVALRLLDIRRGSERTDPEAVDMLMKAAEEGDASAMCAFGVIPIDPYNERTYAERSARGLQMVERGLALGHPACMASKGIQYLFGKTSGISQNTIFAMPLLFESARQGYYRSANALFSLRYQKSLANQFDFTELFEFKRALCWGRLAEQHTNWAGFDHFLGLLRDYAREYDRPDLVEISRPYDPRLVPITHAVVKPEDCIQLEQGE
jgi:TPR repeat protein